MSPWTPLSADTLYFNVDEDAKDKVAGRGRWEAFDMIDRASHTIGNVQFIYASRLQNSIADSLAKVGLSRSHLFKVWWLSLAYMVPLG
ncbi:hypothetical protein GQ457_16G017120 [Hibiscus cannabinus]